MRDTMAHGDGLGSWVVRLDADHPLDQHSVDPRVLTHGLAVLGPGAVRWALHTAAVDAARIVAELPGMGGEGQLPVIRRGAELSAILTLLRIMGAEMGEDDARIDERDVITELVHRRVPAEVLWQGSRRSHDLLMSALFDACAQWVDPQDLADEIRHVASTALRVYNALAIRSAEEYADESRRWLASELAVRDGIVRSLLEDDGDQDPATLMAQLPYAILGRRHLGILVWRSDQGSGDAGDLVRAATDWLGTRGARQVLALPQGRTVVRAWGNGKGDWLTAGASEDQLGAGVRLAHGGLEVDLAGFRRTHADAARAHQVARAAPGLAGAVLDHREVALLSMLLTDREQAERFVAHELGALAAPDPRVAELRRTLSAYLHHRSPKRVAEQLFVARNTVGYRLQQAEELLGRPLEERTTELACALLLREVLGEGDT